MSKWIKPQSSDWGFIKELTMRLIDRSGKSYYGMQIGFAAIQDSVVEGTMFHYLDQQTKANYD